MDKTLSLLGFVKKYTDVSKDTVYKHVRNFEDELKKEGIIKIVRRGAVKRIHVIDADRLLNFLKENGIYLKVDE